MTAVPHLSVYVFLTGQKFGCSSPKLLTWWCYIVRMTTVAVLCSQVVGEVYSMNLGKTVPSSSIFFISATVLRLITFFRIRGTGEKIMRTMDSVTSVLPKVNKLKIRSYSRMHFLCKGLYCAVLFTLVFLYFTYVGLGPEVKTLITGFKTSESMTLQQAVLTYALSVVMYSQHTVLVQMYAVILFSVIEKGKYVREKLFRDVISGHPDYEDIRDSLHKYNEQMTALNESAAILPFTLLATIFIGFSSGISFFVTNGSRLSDPPYFAIVTVGALNLRCLILAFQILELGNKVQKMGEKLWSIASDSTGLTPDSYEKRRHSEARKSLKFFLMSESPVPAKACENLIIRRSMILNFFNQLIPFTVMMFTTIKECERRTNFKSV